MFHKVISSFICLILAISTLSFTVSASAEAFTPSGDFDVINLSSCNLSVKYNKSKFQQNILTIASEQNYFLTSNANDKVFARFYCSTTQPKTKMVDLGPFWTGSTPDLNENFGVKAYGSDPSTAGHVSYLKNNNYTGKTAAIAYSYLGTGVGSLYDLNNGTFSTQAQIQNTDLSIKLISAPAEPVLTSSSNSVSESDFEKLEYPLCNTYVRYNKSKLKRTTDTTGYDVLKANNGKGYFSFGCKVGYAKSPFDANKIAFWIGEFPDYSKYEVFVTPIYHYDDPNPKDEKLYYNINPKENTVVKGTFGIELYYLLDDQNRKLGFTPETMARTLDMSVNDVQIDLINKSNTAPASPTTASEPTKTIETTEIKNKSFKFDAAKYPSCTGKIGKYLDMAGNVVKKPKSTAKLIYADTAGTIVGTDDNIIYCVKSAKKYGVVVCKDKDSQIFDFKGKKIQAYPRGKIFYANGEFGNIYTNKQNAINCTENIDLLPKISW